VSSLSGYISTVPRVNILVNPIENRPNGFALVGWRTSDGAVYGNCLVAPNGEVFEYKKDRVGTPGSNLGVESNWGQRLTGGFTGEVLPGPPVTLYSRPSPSGQPMGQLPGGDQVTFTRTYTDGGVTWYLARGGRGQEGWLDARRVTQRGSGTGGNYGGNPAVEYSWGNNISPYRDQIVPGPALDILNSPSRANARSVGLVGGGENVTVYRSYTGEGTNWLLVKGARGQEGWINSRRLTQSNAQGGGSNPQVEYNWGQPIRPYQTQVLSSSLLGQLLGAGAPSTLELQSRPNKEQPIRYVGSVSASEPVTVTRRFSDGTVDWVLVRGSRGQEGWLNSRRLSQY
jgi:SH3-like domain-containing protein